MNLPLHTCPGILAATARNQATSGGGLGGRLFIPFRLRGSWAEGERILCQSTFRALSSFFYVPQDIDIMRDGTYGLKCHPKHWATRS